MKPRQKLMSLLIRLLIITSLISVCSPVTAATAPAAQPAAAPIKVQAPKAAEPALDLNAAVSDFVTNLPDGYFGMKDVDALKALQADPKPFLIELCEPKEITQTIESAINIPARSLLNTLDKLPTKDTLILLYCGVGQRGVA